MIIISSFFFFLKGLKVGEGRGGGGDIKAIYKRTRPRYVSLMLTRWDSSMLVIRKGRPNLLRRSVHSLADSEPLVNAITTASDWAPREFGFEVRSRDES